MLKDHYPRDMENKTCISNISKVWWRYNSNINSFVPNILGVSELSNIDVTIICRTQIRIPGISVGFVLLNIYILCIMLCGSSFLFNFLGSFCPFSFGQCLFFFYLRLLITPLITSNFSQIGFSCDQNSRHFCCVRVAQYVSSLSNVLWIIVCFWLFFCCCPFSCGHCIVCPSPRFTTSDYSFELVSHSFFLWSWSSPCYFVLSCANFICHVWWLSFIFMLTLPVVTCVQKSSPFDINLFPSRTSSICFFPKSTKLSIPFINAMVTYGMSFRCTRVST